MPRLVAALLALALALAVAGCSNDSDPEKVGAGATSTLADSEASSSTSAPGDEQDDAGTDTGTAPAQGSDGSSGSTAATGGSRSKGDSPTNAPAGLPTPPKAGTYAYKLKATGPDGTSERDTTSVVTDVARNGSETLQRLKIETAQGVLDNDLSWRPDSVLVLRTVTEVGGQKIDCDWNPDLLQAALPFSTGKTWQSDSSCSTTAFGQQMQIRNTASSRVTRTERVTVGEDMVDAWVIESTTRTEIKGQTVAQTIDAKSTTWFAPAIGMIVRQNGTSTASGGPGQPPQERSTEMVLLSTTPR